MRVQRSRTSQSTACGGGRLPWPGRRSTQPEYIGANGDPLLLESLQVKLQLCVRVFLFAFLFLYNKQNLYSECVLCLLCYSGRDESHRLLSLFSFVKFFKTVKGP